MGKQRPGSKPRDESIFLVAVEYFRKVLAIATHTHTQWQSCHRFHLLKLCCLKSVVLYFSLPPSLCFFFVSFVQLVKMSTRPGVRFHNGVLTWQTDIDERPTSCCVGYFILALELGRSLTWKLFLTYFWYISAHLVVLSCLEPSV